MNNLEKFQQFDDLVRAFYEKESLRDLDAITVDGKNIVSFFIETVRKKQTLQPFVGDVKFYHDLLFITRDVKYYTALLYFFKPYITDSAINGTYYQNQEDRRYMTNASSCHQCIYNYWDRIGDLLNLFFKTGLTGNVYLTRVLNNLPSQYKTSPHYIWLNDTFNNKIRAFIGERDDIVHKCQLECQFYWRVMDAKMNPALVKVIQTEKEALPDKFKEQMELMLEGLSRALQLINECPDKP